MKILCWLGFHSYPNIKITKREMHCFFFLNYVEFYGYGKCKSCGKGRRFKQKSDEIWRKIRKIDRRTLKQKLKWAVRDL